MDLDDLEPRRAPAGKFVTPARIGELVIFMCSEATARMTGAALALDGSRKAQ